MYKEYHLGFIMVYLGHDIREIEEKEESEDWFSLYSSIPVLENIGIDTETKTILDKFGITLSDLSRAYDEIVSLNFEDMSNHVFTTEPFKEVQMIVYHDKAAQVAYKKWRRAWQAWRNDKTKAHNRRARRYESKFKRHVVGVALKEHLLLNDAQFKRFTYRLDGRNMRVYHHACFVGLAYVSANIDDTGTTQVSFMLANEVYEEYW